MSVRLLPPPPTATLDDLLQVEGKAELIGGRIVRFKPTGYRPNVIAGRIFRSLADSCDSTGKGEAFTDSIGFAVPLLPSGRQSFSPDASYYVGPAPVNEMKFVDNPPTFAVEFRSENDYGRAAEIAMSEKRDDYFLAGTFVVWDVDPIANVIDCYRADAPGQATRFATGMVADAEPGVSGWRVAVDRLMA